MSGFDASSADFGDLERKFRQLFKGKGVTPEKIGDTSHPLLGLDVLDLMADNTTGSESLRAKALIALFHDYLHRATPTESNRALAVAMNLDVSESWGGQITVYSSDDLQKRRKRFADEIGRGINENGTPVSTWEKRALTSAVRELVKYTQPPIFLDGSRYEPPPGYPRISADSSSQEDRTADQPEATDPADRAYGQSRIDADPETIEDPRADQPEPVQLRDLNDDTAHDRSTVEEPIYSATHQAGPEVPPIPAPVQAAPAPVAPRFRTQVSLAAVCGLILIVGATFWIGRWSVGDPSASDQDLVIATEQTSSVQDVPPRTPTATPAQAQAAPDSPDPAPVLADQEVTPTATPTVPPTPTLSPTAPPTPTASPTPTTPPTPTSSPTPTATASPTPTATASPTPTATASPTPTATARATATPRPVPTPSEYDDCSGWVLGIEPSSAGELSVLNDGCPEWAATFVGNGTIHTWRMDLYEQQRVSIQYRGTSGFEWTTKVVDPFGEVVWTKAHRSRVHRDGESFVADTAGTYQFVAESMHDGRGLGYSVQFFDTSQGS